MSGRRKDYRVDAAPETISLRPTENLVVRFHDAHGGAQTFDFRPHAARADMAAVLALALRMHGADKTCATRATIFASSVRAWFAFLAAHDPAQRLCRGGDTDAALVRAFLVWLDGRPTRIGTRYAQWSGMRTLLRWLLRHRPELVGADLVLPYNAFPRKNALTAPRAGLGESEIDAVLAACRKEIDSAWAHFRAGEAALARVDRVEIAAIPDLKHLDLADLGVLMAVVLDRCGGVVPHSKKMLSSGAGLWRLIGPIRQLGGVPRFARYLYPDSRALIPFVIAIGAQTFANADALLEFTRDCASEHPLFDNRIVVAWRKGRASKLQRRSFLKDRSLSPARLIAQVLAMTERLTPMVPSADRDRLFLYASMHGKGRHYGVLNGNTALQQIERFVADHDLRGAGGRPMRLHLAALRTTGLMRAHAALGYDLVKTQALANHASLDTTRRYVDRPLARAAQAREMARLQGVFVDWVRGDAPEVARTLGATATAAADIAAGRNATASGFVCRNPLAGAGPEQTPGRLCTAWLGCFTCPNAVIPLDPETLARVNRHLKCPPWRHRKHPLRFHALAFGSAGAGFCSRPERRFSRSR